MWPVLQSPTGGGTWSEMEKLLCPTTVVEEKALTPQRDRRAASQDPASLSGSAPDRCSWTSCPTQQAWGKLGPVSWEDNAQVYLASGQIPGERDRLEGERTQLKGVFWLRISF